MTDDPGHEYSERSESRWLNIIERLLLNRTTTGFRNIHLWIILFFTAVLTYLYYGILPDFHDVFAVLFFYPLVYTAVLYRWRGVLISGLIFLGILLPYALLISVDPNLLLRSLVFALLAILICSLIATQLNLMEWLLNAYRDVSNLNEELQGYIERLENTQRQLIQAEKLNAIGQLAASVAHEINNPLAGVLVYTKLMTKKFTNDNFNKEETLTNLSKIEVAVNHCSTIIRSLLDFSRQSDPVLQPVAVDDVINEVLTLVGHQAEINQVVIEKRLAEPSPVVLADSSQLKQVFINLIINAIQAMPDGGSLTIESTVEDNLVSIAFRDAGCGISSENMDKLFTPFFTTKEAVKGVGLGLAVSYGIVERHNGYIEVQSQLGEGSTFTVHVPSYTPPEEV